MSGVSYQVWILNQSMEKLAILDDYQSLSWTRRWQQPNSFELHCSRHARGAENLVEDNLLQVVRDGEIEFTAIIEHGELALDESGKASEVWICRGGDVLTRRHCLPPSGQSHDERSGAAETVMKGYVTANVISPSDADRTIDLVSNEADSGRGASVAIAARYQPLVEKLEETARAGGIGWELVGGTSGLEFTIVEGTDRSTEQSTNPPIIFSPDFGNLRTLGYQWSMLNRATLAYVAGQGEGADRTIREVYAGATTPTGLGRRESFIDARDLDDNSKLADRGRAKLDEQGPKERLEAQILTGGPFRYRDDWDLGDVVTVRNLDWDVLSHLRVAAVTVSLEAGSGEYIEVAFGAPPANLISVVKQGIAAGEVVQRSEGGGSVDLSGYQQTSEKGQANGYAGLGSDGKYPYSELSGVPDLLGNADRVLADCAYQSAGLTANTSWQDIPGLSLSFTLAKRSRVHLRFSGSWTSNDNTVHQSHRFVVDGIGKGQATYGSMINMNGPSSSTNGWWSPVFDEWWMDLDAGTHTVKSQASANGGSGTFTVEGTQDYGKGWLSYTAYPL